MRSSAKKKWSELSLPPNTNNINVIISVLWHWCFYLIIYVRYYRIQQFSVISAFISEGYLRQHTKDGVFREFYASQICTILLVKLTLHGTSRLDVEYERARDAETEETDLLSYSRQLGLHYAGSSFASITMARLPSSSCFSYLSLPLLWVTRCSWRIQREFIRE